MRQKLSLVSLISLALFWLAGCGIAPDANPNNGSSAHTTATSPITSTPLVDTTPGTPITTPTRPSATAAQLALPTPTARLIQIVTATSSASSTLPTPTALPTRVVSPGAGLSQTQLRYAIITRFGIAGATPPIFFCDPDLYPVARNDENTNAEKWFASADKASSEYKGILGHLGLSDAALTTAQKILAYREHKMLNAVALEPAVDGYQFSVRVSQRGSANGKTGEQTDGNISPQGNITIIKQSATALTCPICLAYGARIDTPDGPIPVQDLRPGMLVWTANHDGLRVAALITRISHTPVPASHEMVHLRLSDGRQLRASPGHPTIDGRTIGALLPGDALDGAWVTSITREPYTAGQTYDVLPTGDTGFYWADGVEVASTLEGE